MVKDGSAGREELDGVHGLGPLPDFKMELRRVHVPGAADGRDDLPLCNGVATLHDELFIVGVGGRPAVGMFDEEKIAETAQLIARVGDDAVVGGAHLGAKSGGNVDAVVMEPAAGVTVMLADGAAAPGGGARDSEVMVERTGGGTATSATSMSGRSLRDGCAACVKGSGIHSSWPGRMT